MRINSHFFVASFSSFFLRATTTFLIAPKKSRKHLSLKNLCSSCLVIAARLKSYTVIAPLFLSSPAPLSPLPRSSCEMDSSRLSASFSPHAQALRPEAPIFAPHTSLPSIPAPPLSQALRPQAPTFQPRVHSPPKQVLPPAPVLPTVQRAVEKEEEELGPAPWGTFDCPHCDRSNGCEWMIACSGEHEALEWAHLSCVGLSAYDFPDGADREKKSH